jgi:DNA-binding transcriptional LysR family regulator
MARDSINNLTGFVAVAREKSFTKAASKLGVSQSALSHSIRGLEAQLGMSLLTRTSRRVSPTEAGERLLQTIGPHLDGIEMGLASIAEMRGKPSGNIRITTTEHVAETILWPAVEKLVSKYPDIGVEIVIDFGLSDIVSERFDAGIRLGDAIAKDMVAVRIGPDLRMAVVASPWYFERQGHPKTPDDLVDHQCINLRLTSAGGLSPWEFEKDGRELNVRAEGKLVFNTPKLRINAALAGLGLAFLPEDQVIDYIAQGRLVRVLEDWCPTFPGYYLYFASRRQATQAFRLLVDALRFVA